MAQTATIFNLTIDLSDVDRGIYEKIELRIARHPSETAEFMFVRALAYCLEFQDGIALTEGVAAGSEPAILIRNLTGQTIAWIEVGLPDPARLHRGMKLAGRAAVYTHRGRKLLAQLSGTKIYKAAEIPIFALDAAFIDGVAGLIDRRTAIGLTVMERQIYLTIGARDFSSAITEHRIPA